MSKIISTEAVKASNNTRNIINRFTSMAQSYGFETKRASDNSATQLNRQIDRENTCKLTVPHTPYGVRKWADILHKLQTDQKLTVKDLEPFYFDFPAEYLKLSDEELVNAVLTDLEYRSFENSHSETGKQRLKSVIRQIVKQGGAATEDQVMVWTEDGRLDFKIGENVEYELGRLSMLAELMEGNYLHDACITALADGLKAHQKALQDSELTEAFPGMLYCDFKRSTNGTILADGYVIQDDGTILPHHANLRKSANVNPLNEGILAWFGLKETDIMISFYRETATSPLHFCINKKRTKNGIVEKPNVSQQATIDRLATDLGLTWHPQIDFSEPDAYLQLVGKGWDFSTMSTNAAYNLIQHYASRLELVSQLPIGDLPKVTTNFQAGKFKVFVDGAEYAVNIAGVKKPLFTSFSQRQARMFARFVQAYEIRVFQYLARKEEAEEAHKLTAAGISKEDQAILLEQRTRTRNEIADRFRSKLAEINQRPKHLMILFDNEQDHGVYLGIEGMQANYFSFTTEDFEQFRTVIGEIPEPRQAATLSAGNNDLASNDVANNGENPIGNAENRSHSANGSNGSNNANDSNDSDEIPGQMTLAEQTDQSSDTTGNANGVTGKTSDATRTTVKMITSENRRETHPIHMPGFITQAAENKRAREAEAKKAAAESSNN